MQQTALYELVKEAKSKNMAVQLLTPYKDSEFNFIIEPENEIKNKPGNIISSDGCLIDLSFIMGAVIVPNHKDRLKQIEEELNDYRRQIQEEA